MARTRLVFIFAGCLSMVLSAQSPTARTLVTESINDSKTVKLAGNTRPEAIAANDKGRVSDVRQFQHMLLMLNRPAEREAALQVYASELSDSKSGNYHRWLTAKQIGEQYGPSKSDVETVKEWLTSHGFIVNAVSPTRDLIDFSGPARSIQSAFHTEIHQLNVRGESHLANINDPTIPAALAELVKGVASFNNFRPKPQSRKQLTADASVDYTSGSNYLLVPADLATIYSLNPLYASGLSGQGQTIAVMEDSDVASPADWLAFRKRFALTKAYPYGTLSQVHPRGGLGGNCADPGLNPAEVEADIDVQWASAAAPNANIVLAACDDTDFNFGGFVALENLLTGDNFPPAIVSISYGEAEAFLGSGFNAYIGLLYELAALEGVSVYVSAGDNGADAADPDVGNPIATYGINASGFATTPFNVAVGGTDFSDSYFGTNSTYWNSTNAPNGGSAKSYIPEIPWNDSCASTLIANYLGYATTYGTTGLCNNAPSFLNIVAGSGGPSSCAFGDPNVPGAASSGGCSGYRKPAWQSVAGMPQDGVRDIPDISLFAANGVWGHAYLICFSDATYGGIPCNKGLLGYGGTSFGAPILAGFQALVNQYTGTAWGNPNPVLYALARKEYRHSGRASCNSSLGNAVSPSCTFYDVTLGDMDVVCTAGSYNCYAPAGTYGVLSTSTSSYQPAYTTATGWDFATGIGTVNAYNLVTNWLDGALAATP